MTRFIHAQFAKDYLEGLLSSYGEIQSPPHVAEEICKIDLYFIPKSDLSSSLTNLGLLGQIATYPSLIEPFRRPATPSEICECLLQLLEVQKEYQREVNPNNRTKLKIELPRLWIFTPTASVNVLSGFGAIFRKNWPKGVYFLPEYLKTAIIVIHQLPRTPETLWLRILGRGRVQRQAIDELEALSINHRLRFSTLELFYQLQENLKVNPRLNKEDKELIMRLQPLYQERLTQVEKESIQQGIQKGIQQGKRSLLENFLRSRFGDLDEETLAIIDLILKSPPEEQGATLLLLANLSPEEILERFRDY